MKSYAELTCEDEKKDYARLTKAIMYTNGEAVSGEGAWGFDGFNEDRYVLSLSEDSDLLSQWITYCRNGGVCIEFDTGVLIDSAKKYIGENKWANCTTAKMIYEDDLKRSFLSAKMKEALAKVYHKENFDEPFVSGSGLSWAATRYEAARSFKDQAFRSECEWRMLMIYKLGTLAKVALRSSENSVLPYLDMSIDMTAGTGLTVSPMGDADSSVKWLSKFCIQNFSHGVTVTKSGTQFRNRR